MSEFRVVPYLEQPELLKELGNLEEESFPDFLNEDPAWTEVAPHFYQEFAAFQFFIVEEKSNKVVGLCNNVPFNWDDNPDSLPSYQQMMLGALADWQAGNHKPNTLSGVLVLLDPEYRGQGLVEMLGGNIIGLAKQHEMTSIMVAVRPTLKEQYPLVSIEEYIQWKNADGKMFDPWLRAQALMGSKLVKAEPQSTVIDGSVAQWEAWTKMTFPVSGDYWVPGALSTVHIDLENDLGRHYEPHVWYKTPVA